MDDAETAVGARKLGKAYDDDDDAGSGCGGILDLKNAMVNLTS